jgi:hypothetical protein
MSSPGTPDQDVVDTPRLPRDDHAGGRPRTRRDDQPEEHLRPRPARDENFPEDEVHPEEHPPEEDVFEDASDAGEVFVRRRPACHPPSPPRPMVHETVSRVPHIKPEDYDGTTEWSEYYMYFEQMSELYGWDDGTKAMILGVCLKGEARLVLASMDVFKRHSYFAVVTALEQSFSPQGKVHLYQAELKARRRKPEESMSNLGRDIAKLVRLAYPTADIATREVIGINSFLDALPGPASEMKLHVIKGRPRTLQEAVAHATEVDAVIEAESRRNQRKRGEVRVVTEADEKMQKLEQLCKELEANLASANEEKDRRERRRREMECFYCKEKGHMKRSCPKWIRDGRPQGNGTGRLDHQ